MIDAPDGISVDIPAGFNFTDRVIADRHRTPQAAVPLAPQQRDSRDHIRRKMVKQVYKFAAVPCPSCEGRRFAVVSLWDYHDLWYPVSSCMECGLLHANPRLRAEDYVDLYRRHYRSLYSSSPGPTGEFINEQISRGRALVRRIEDLRGPVRGSLVYEVGCGAGGILRAFAQAGCTVAGTDFDTSYLAAAGRLEVDVVEGGTEALLGRPPADVIILSHVFEHFWDLSTDLDNLRRALKGNGLIYVEAPGIFGLRDWRAGNYTLLTQTAHTLHLTLASLTRLMQQHGFVLITGDEYIRSFFAPDSKTLGNVQLAHLSVLEQTQVRQRAAGTAGFRQAYMRCRWENLGLRFGPDANVALYGAGRHTEYLLDSIRRAPGPTVSVILDDDPAKEGTTLAGVPVTNDLPDRASSPSAIVISSDNYEARMAAAARQKYGSRLPIIRLYEGLPPGPYPV